MLVALTIAVGLWSGCQSLMPGDLKGIQAKLEVQTQKFLASHPESVHEENIRGRSIRFVEVSGGPPKPLVLFVHGSPGEWAGWIEFLRDPDLEANAQLIAVDRPGFGGSGTGKAERSVEEQSRIIGSLLERAAPGQRVVLVGHSYGGPVVCRMAMDFPEKVTDLVVLAGSIDPTQEETHWYQYPADWWLFRWLVPTDLVTANQEIMPLKSSLNAMLPRWGEIRQRVSVIQGDADTLVPPANADFAERMMTNAQPMKVIRIPGMNHFLPWKQFSLVKEVILSHLGITNEPSRGANVN